jgi:hypothetical protein
MTLIIGRTKEEVKARTAAIRNASDSIITDRLRAELYHAQNGLCIVCWRPLQEDWVSIDHAISIRVWADSPFPIEEMVRQANLRQNLIAVHPVSNSIKNGSDCEEFAAHLEADDISIDAPELMTTERVRQLKEQLSAAGRKGGRTSGRMNVENGHMDRMRELPQTKAAQRKSGRRNVETGHLSRIRELPQTKAGQRKNGCKQLARAWGLPQTKAAQRRNGLKAVETGQLARILELPQTKAAHLRNGRIRGRKSAEDGTLARALHTRWHVNRNIVSPNWFAMYKFRNATTGGIGETHGFQSVIFCLVSR